MIFFLVYLPVLIAFALIFHLLLPTQGSYSDPGTSFLKVKDSEYRSYLDLQISQRIISMLLYQFYCVEMIIPHKYNDYENKSVSL